MKKLLTLLSVAFSAIICTSAGAQSKTGFHVIKTFHISGPAGWDYIEVGPVHDWVYVSHGTQVNILNKKTGDSVGVIENTPGVHGIAFDQANGKGFTSNGRANNVTVFDMNTNKVLAQIPTGENPDAIFYDPFSKRIVTCNGRSKDLSFIDPVGNKVTNTVSLGGRPETAVSDGEGRIYVNIEDKNQIAEIDAKTFAVLNYWSIAPGEGPTGLAIDRKTKRLFAGCDKLLMVIDATNGKVIDKITIGDGCDGVAFDPEYKFVYTSNGIGNLSVIEEQSASKFTLLENVPTKPGARTIGLDKETHFICLPTAEFEPADPNQKGRPKMKPGTFQILVVGK